MCNFNITVDENKLARDSPGIYRERFTSGGDEEKLYICGVECGMK